MQSVLQVSFDHRANPWRLMRRLYSTPLLFEHYLITQCTSYGCQQRSNWLFEHYRTLTSLLGKNLHE